MAQTIEQIKTRIENLTGHRSTDLDDLMELFEETARLAGVEDALIDLWTAGELTDDAVEFEMGNTGAADPRR